MSALCCRSQRLHIYIYIYIYIYWQVYGDAVIGYEYIYIETHIIL